MIYCLRFEKGTRPAAQLSSPLPSSKINMFTDLDVLLCWCEIVLVLNFEIELSSFKNIRVTFVNVKSVKREHPPFFFFLIHGSYLCPLTYNMKWPVSDTRQVWFYQMEKNIKGSVRILKEGYVNMSGQRFGI